MEGLPQFSTDRKGASSPGPGESAPLWEDVATLVAIGTLWPVILGWPHPAWRWVLYGTAALMVFVFIRKLRRLWRLQEKQRKRGGPFMPGGQLS